MQTEQVHPVQAPALVTDPTLIKVMAIKKKYVEQMPKVENRALLTEAEVVGLVKGHIVTLKTR